MSWSFDEQSVKVAILLRVPEKNMSEFKQELETIISELHAVLIYATTHDGPIRIVKE